MPQNHRNVKEQKPWVNKTSRRPFPPVEHVKRVTLIKRGLP